MWQLQQTPPTLPIQHHLLGEYNHTNLRNKACNCSNTACSCHNITSVCCTAPLLRARHRSHPSHTIAYVHHHLRHATRCDHKILAQASLFQLPVWKSSEHAVYIVPLLLYRLFYPRRLFFMLSPLVLLHWDVSCSCNTIPTLVATPRHITLSHTTSTRSVSTSRAPFL